MDAITTTTHLTTTHLTGLVASGPQNWIPAVLQFRPQSTIPWDPTKNPLRVAAQLNGDGTLYVNWPDVEAMARAAPLVPGGGCEIAHLMLALRDGRFVDAPRDYQYPPALGT